MSPSELPTRQRGACCEVQYVADPAWTSEVAELLRALADPTRLSMVACLWRVQDPVCVCDFTATFELTQPTISHHMAKLRTAGLVRSEKRGIWVYYSLRNDLPATTTRLLQTLMAVVGSSFIDASDHGLGPDTLTAPLG